LNKVLRLFSGHTGGGRYLGIEEFLKYWILRFSINVEEMLAVRLVHEKSTSGKSFRPPGREYFEVKGHYFRRTVILNELT
jgi:hypothetical protein